MIITIQKCLVPQCEGAAHKWEFETPTLREFQRMEKIAGISVDQFAGGLDDALDTGITSAAIDAVLAMVDMLHRREGVKVPFEDIDIDPTDFKLDVADGDLDADDEPGEASEDGAGKDPDPTPPSHPHEATAPDAPASGPESGEASEPRSSLTPTASGGGSASP
ncbi:hypothetical protein [Actinomadura sp. NPDC049753]|uniref:hypothetical protein n=1 Tax=Actinomadura sp. NPDC049753 TaxID=3154739 RepID=UPI00341FE9EA